jgi:hypothetical protein
MKRITKRSSIIAVTAAATVLVTGGVAFAYWTTSGTGTAEAAVAGDAGTLIVEQSGTISGLYPGGPAQDVSVIVTNDTDADLSFSDVTVAVTGTDDPGCTALDFAFDDTAYTGEVVEANTSTLAIVPKQIRMINRPTVNQDGCKNATVSLSLSAS